jgi:hypothetical protein
MEQQSHNRQKLQSSSEKSDLSKSNELISVVKQQQEDPDYWGLIDNGYIQDECLT